MIIINFNTIMNNLPKNLKVEFIKDKKKIGKIKYWQTNYFVNYIDFLAIIKILVFKFKKKIQRYW